MGKYSDRNRLQTIQKKNRPRGRPRKYEFIETKMEYIKPVEKLNLDGNISEKWRIFKQNVQVFGTAIEIEKKTSKVQVAILLNALGPEALEVFNSFNLSKEDSENYEKVLDAFEKFCAPRKNEVYASFLFLSRDQLEGEPFDQFFMDLKKLVRNCGYNSAESRMLRDKIVMGVSDKQLQKRLLEATDLTLDKAIEMSRAAEATREQSKEMCKTTNEENYNNRNRSAINVIQGETSKFKCNRNTEMNKAKVKYNSNEKKNYHHNKNPNSNSRNYHNNNNGQTHNKTLYNCKSCTQRHIKGRCTAYGKTCTNCGKKNHVAIACTLKSQMVGEINLNEKTDDFYIDAINELEKPNKTSWYETIRVNDSFIKFKLDSGADVNVIPLRILKKIKGAELTEEEVKIEGYGDSLIPTVGYTQLSCYYKNEITLSKFIITQNTNTPILGLETCTKLKLIQRIYAIITVETEKENFLHKSADVFEGLGCFIKDFEIKIKNNSTPIVKPCRRLPLTLKNKLKEELDKLLKKGIIEKSEEAVATQ